jgi:hypothetical protein
MKAHILFTISFILFLNQVYSQINQVWVARYNNEYNMDDMFCSMITDKNENIYVTGKSQSPGFYYRITTIKYNKSGQLKWVAEHRPFGEPHDIAIDINGNIYVTSSGYKTTSTMKYDSLGVLKWAKTYDSPNAGLSYWAKVQTIDKYIYVAGRYGITNNGWGNILLKYDTSGTLIWPSVIANYVNCEYIFDMKVSNKSKNIYLTGTTIAYDNNSVHYKILLIKINSQGNILWKKEFDPIGICSESYALDLDTSDNVFITGHTYKTPSAYDYHMVVVKIDSTGLVNWYRLTDGQTDESERGHAIKVDNAGNIIATGFGINFNLLTVKYNTYGEAMFVTYYPDTTYSGGHYGYAISSDSLNNVYVTGQTNSSDKSGLITLKYSASGNVLWNSSYSPTYNGINRGTKIIVTGVDEVLSGGFGSRLAGSYEIFDYILIKYSNNVGINKQNGQIPKEYILYQNYPNPFNPTTKIRFEVPNGFPTGTFGNDIVVLKVYDITGRDVQTLVNESLQPGTYEVSFDGSGLNSGVYFYKLTAGDYSRTKKMVLIK